MTKGSEQVQTLAGEGGSQSKKSGSVTSRVSKDDRLALAARKVAKASCILISERRLKQVDQHVLSELATLERAIDLGSMFETLNLLHISKSKDWSGQ